jgi:hypothetical protein
MSTQRPVDATPDLFSAPPTAKAPEPEHSAIPQRKGEPDDAASQSRHFLPKDLAGALKRLDDAEIDSLLAAVVPPSKLASSLSQLRGSSGFHSPISGRRLPPRGGTKSPVADGGSSTEPPDGHKELAASDPLDWRDAVR